MAAYIFDSRISQSDSHNAIIKIFNNALSDMNWPNNDRPSRQESNVVESLAILKSGWHTSAFMAHMMWHIEPVGYADNGAVGPAFLLRHIPATLPHGPMWVFLSVTHSNLWECCLFSSYFACAVCCARSYPEILAPFGFLTFLSRAPSSSSQWACAPFVFFFPCHCPGCTASVVIRQCSVTRCSTQIQSP